MKKNQQKKTASFNTRKDKASSDQKATQGKSTKRKNTDVPEENKALMGSGKRQDDN